MQQKLAIKAAGQNFAADPAFRARIQRSLGANKNRFWQQRWFPVLATAALLLVAGAFFVQSKRSSESQVIGEVADLHVATLASTTPVDVVSTDRHTVKPWFEGKIPFTFNLPELQGTDFSLIGGRVTYLSQVSGAHLIYRIRKHEISVFIFPVPNASNTTISGPVQARSFNFEDWTHNGLRYFVVGDVGANDMETLGKLLRDAK